MTHVVTESCIRCRYTDCVDVCPVDCFREGPNFLVIDPDECIDCALCEPECPAQAIFSEDEVPAGQEAFIELNSELANIWPNITEKKEALPEKETAATPKADDYELVRLFDRLIDRLDALAAARRAEKEDRLAPGGEPLLLTDGLLEPLQMLMEAVYTGDGEYALKAAPQIAAALNDEGVRLVEYSPETRDYFDLFPGTQPDLTIRPAVMQGERVLARGQATEEL